jgi:hypothetical protein
MCRVLHLGLGERGRQGPVRRFQLGCLVLRLQGFTVIFVTGPCDEILWLGKCMDAHQLKRPQLKV